MHSGSLHIRSIHEASGSDLFVPDIDRSDIRVVLVKHQYDQSHNALSECSWQSAEYTRRHTKSKFSAIDELRSRLAHYTKLHITMPPSEYIYLHTFGTEIRRYTKVTRIELHGTFHPRNFSASGKNQIYIYIYLFTCYLFSNVINVLELSHCLIR